MKHAIILLATLFTGNLLFAQSEKTEQIKQESPSVVVKKSHKSTRAVQFRYAEIKDKTNLFVEVEMVKYPWFSDKEKAMNYFNKQTLKKDFTILYIDGKDPNPSKPDVVEIEE